MRWTRSARTTTIVAILGVVALIAGTAMAVTVADSDVPSESKVGDPVTATVNLTDLYEEDDRWTLALQTDLESPSWDVEYLNQTGGVVETLEPSDQQAITGPTVSPPVDEIRIELTGETPGIESFEYGSDQSYVGLQVEKRTDSGDETIETWQVTHYTDASRAAKQALDAAREAIDEAQENGADVSEAESDFDSAVEAYNGENPDFGLAEQLANDARDAAEAANEDAGGGGGGLPLIPIVGGVVVLLVVLGGALYYYNKQQQQQRGGRLR